MGRHFGISRHSWDVPNFQRRLLPSCFAEKYLEQKSGKDGLSGISFPENAALSFQGMAGIGIPGTAGVKGEEGEQVGWEFCTKILLEFSVSPKSPPIFTFSLESCGSTQKA